MGHFDFDNIPFRLAPRSEHPSRNHVSNTSQEHLQSQYNTSNESVSQLAAANGSSSTNTYAHEDIPRVDSPDQDWVFVRPAPPTSSTSNGTTDTDASFDQNSPNLCLTMDNLQLHDMINDRSIAERLWDSTKYNTNNHDYNNSNNKDLTGKGKVKSFVAKKGTTATRLSDEDILGGAPWAPVDNGTDDFIAYTGAWADHPRPPFIDMRDLQ